MVLVAMLVVGVSVYAANRQDSSVVDGSAKLTSLVTVGSLPDWVNDVAETDVLPAGSEAQARFGYRARHFTLSGDDQRAMTVSIVEGLPFIPAAEKKALEGVMTDVRAGDVSVSYLTDKLDTTVVHSPAEDVVVSISGPDRDEVVAATQAVWVGVDLSPLPGSPSVLLEGVADAMPWQVVVTTPGADVEGVDEAGRCVVLRWYTSQVGCVQSGSSPTVSPFPAVHPGVGNRVLFVRAAQEATGAVVVQKSGMSTPVVLMSLKPVQGRGLVLISPLDDPVVEVLLKDAKGADLGSVPVADMP